MSNELTNKVNERLGIKVKKTKVKKLVICKPSVARLKANEKLEEPSLLYWWYSIKESL